MAMIRIKEMVTEKEMAETNRSLDLVINNQI